MKTWNSNIVSVLSGANAVIIKTAEDLKAFKDICARIGLDAFKKEKLIDLQASVQRWNRQHNKHFSENAVYYACYENGKGFGFWQDEVENLVDWYGIAPFSMDELLEEVR